MHQLDNHDLIARLDPGDNLRSVDLLGEQLAQAWRGFKRVTIPAGYRKIDQVVINGMGGSALPGHMLQSLYFGRLQKPLHIINGYVVPAMVTKRTLYLIVSYSGNTEEPLSTINQAKKRRAKLFAITAGGKLGELVRRGKLPGYVFEPAANPSGQPRVGVGYTLSAHLALFKRLGLVKLTDRFVHDVLGDVHRFKKQFSFGTSFKQNRAKQLAALLSGKAAAVVAADHLAGNAHIFANQLNETAKTFSSYHLISEMNHHLLEGLHFPQANKKSLHFVFFASSLYHPQNQKRLAITKQVVSRNKVSHATYNLRSLSLLGQGLEMLAFSSYATFYLAMTNGVNPNLIPWVDYFKEQLGKKK